MSSSAESNLLLKITGCTNLSEHAKQFYRLTKDRNTYITELKIIGYVTCEGTNNLLFLGRIEMLGGTLSKERTLSVDKDNRCCGAKPHDWQCFYTNHFAPSDKLSPRLWCLFIRKLCCPSLWSAAHGPFSLHKGCHACGCITTGRLQLLQIPSNFDASSCQSHVLSFFKILFMHLQNAILLQIAFESYLTPTVPEVFLL